MAKESKTIAWEKVSFEEPKRPVCTLTFRPNGQIVFGVETLVALNYPQFVHLFVSPANNLFALKATSKADGDSLQLTTTQLEQDQPRVIMATKVYRWMLNLLGLQEEMLIKLEGVANEDGMVVFDLSKAGIKPKRVRKTANEA